jgi:anti-sigma B factor antagonist
MATDDFRVEPVVEGRAVRLVLTGELDLATAGQLSEAIGRHASAGGAVVLDLRELTFMDSTGLATVINADKAAKSGGWDLALIEGGGPAPRLFDLTDTRTLLRFVDSAAELDAS